MPIIGGDQPRPRASSSGSEPRRGQRVLLDARLCGVSAIASVVAAIDCTLISVDGVLQQRELLENAAVLALSSGELGEAELGRIADVRRVAPHLTIYVVSQNGRGSYPPLRRLALTGADEVFVLGLASEEERLVREIALRLRVPTPSVAIGKAAAQVPREPARTLVTWCLRSGCRRLSVEDAARHFRVERRTLSRWVEESGLPGVRKLLRLGVILHAEQLRANTDLSWGSVARLLGYQSSAALVTLRRRHMDFVVGRPDEAASVSRRVSSCPNPQLPSGSGPATT